MYTEGTGCNFDSALRITSIVAGVILIIFGIAFFTVGHLIVERGLKDHFEVFYY